MGGHCLPVDPFYLAWRAREFDMQTEFVELAGEVNQRMPYFCVDRISRALNEQTKPVKGSRIALVGVSYKPGVGDLRESPALRILRLLRDQGAEVSYHDDFVAELPDLGLRSEWPEDVDCAAIVTAHPGLDLERLVAGGAARGRLPRSHARHRGPAPRAPVIKVGVIGLGYWGPNLARNFDRLPGAELAWVCDESEERVAAQRPGLPACAQLDLHRRPARRRHARRDRPGHARAEPRAAGAAGAARPASTASWRSRSRNRSRRPSRSWPPRERASGC